MIKRLLAVLFIVSFIVAGCVPIHVSIGDTPTPAPTSTPEPTSTPLPTSTPKPTATPLPTATPASLSVVVNGVHLTLIQTSFASSWKFLDNTVSPKAPYDTLALVRFSVEGADLNEPCTWRGTDQAQLRTKTGGLVDSIRWGVCHTNKSGGWVEFIFATYKKQLGTTYTVIFPGGVELPIQIPFAIEQGTGA